MLKKVFANILILTMVLLSTSFGAYADTADLSESISIINSDNGFELKISEKAGTVFEPFDRINIIVLKPNFSFASITDGDVAENAIYLAKNLSGSECVSDVLFSYDFPSTVGNQDDIDTYLIKIAVTATSGDYREANMLYKKISPQYRENAVKLFSEVTAEDFSATWLKVGAPMFDVSDEEEFNRYTSLISKQFVLVRQALFAEQNTTVFADQASIIGCIEKAISLYTLENADKDSAKKMIDKYGFIFDETYDFSKDFTAFYTLYSAVRDDYKNSVSLDYLKKICIMANMQNGSVKKTLGEISECIRKYAAELKIDLSYALNKNVSINKIAARIDSDNISKYYKNEAWFNEIVDVLYSEAASGDSSSPSQVGGGSGGRGSSIGIGGTSNKPSDDNNINLPQGVQQNVFDDLDGYDWAKDAIEALYEKNVVSGDGSGNYYPSRNVTREEFVKMLCLAFDVYSPMDDKGKIEFEDVDAQDWFYPYVCVAKMNGLVNGKSETLFGTGENITRQDMACMLYNLLNCKNVNIVPENNQFSDNGAISPYAENAVDTLTTLGIIGGFDDNTFRPLENADRGQAAKVIYTMALYLN